MRCLTTFLLVAVCLSTLFAASECRGNIKTDDHVRILEPKGGVKSGKGGVASAVMEEPPISSKVPIPVDQVTHVISKKEYEETDPYGLKIRHVWTPNGKWPEPGTGIDRALKVANSTFIVAAVESGHTSLSVYYNTKAETKKVDFGVIDGTHYGSYCSGPFDRVHELPTNFDRVLMSTELGRKALTITEILTVLYTKCLQTVRESLLAKIGKSNLLIRSADLGPLKTLLPSKNKKNATPDSTHKLVQTWFNNVNIFYEGSSPFRILMNSIARHNQLNIEKDLWSFVKTADHHLRHNTGHVFTRIHRGTWEAYFELVAAVSVHDKEDKFEPESTLYIGLDDVSTELAYRIGTEEVSQERQPEGVPIMQGAAFVEVEAKVGAAAKGPLQLNYPKKDNPGRVYTKSLLGSGPVAMLIETAKIAYRKFNKETLVPGTKVELPCLAKGVVIERRSVVSPYLTFGEAICWGNRGYETFDKQICKYLSYNHELLEAVIRGRVSFVGTSKLEECEADMMKVLNGTDAHLYPQSYTRQFDILTDEQGALSPAARQKISHIVVGHPLLSHSYDQVCGTFHPKIDPYSSDAPDEPSPAKFNISEVEYDAFIDSCKKGEGISSSQLRTFLSILGGSQFGSKKLEKMYEHDYMLPILGTFTEVLLDRLGLTLTHKWNGRISFKNIDWVDGAADFYGGIVRDDKDNVLKTFYTSQHYQVPQTSNEDPEDEEVWDDPRKIQELRDQMMAKERKIKERV